MKEWKVGEKQQIEGRNRTRLTTVCCCWLATQKEHNTTIVTLLLSGIHPQDNCYYISLALFSPTAHSKEFLLFQTGKNIAVKLIQLFVKTEKISAVCILNFKC
ncbi:hypothetical protein ILYODFUR_014951 [Ilyodon furcidens]|uniref:Uncharacterized protein n=1 Tax=Ilyodon furcidens TaxID=33524 RepID=A0ABV0V452_9TELE